MSCSTMPAQFGSSSKAACSFDPFVARSSRNTSVYFCANGEKKSRLPLVRRDVDQRILRHRINSFQNSIGIHFASVNWKSPRRTWIAVQFLPLAFSFKISMTSAAAHWISRRYRNSSRSDSSSRSSQICPGPAHKRVEMSEKSQIPLCISGKM